MAAVFRYALMLGLCAACVACDEPTGPTAPGGRGPVPPPPPLPPVTQTPLPPIPGPATTFGFHGPLPSCGAQRVRAFTEASSFVLYENGIFDFEYESIPFTFRGRYERSDEHVAFYFGEDEQVPNAIGKVNGDLIEVCYSERMQHSDFESASYQRVE